MVDDSHIDEAPGGETACYAHFLCQDCGIVLDGGAHLATCPRAPTSDVTTEIAAEAGHVTRRA